MASKVLDDSKHCAACRIAHGKYRCVRCRNVYYCDQECQKHHWETHKLNCNPNQSSASSATKQKLVTVENHNATVNGNMVASKGLDDFVNCAACHVLHGKYKCTSCKNVSYCGKECQKIHWKIHKPICIRNPNQSAASSTIKPKKTEISVENLEAMMNEGRGGEKSLQHWHDVINFSPQYADVRDQLVVLDIPLFHEEYKRVYPYELSQFKTLKSIYNAQKLWGVQAILLGEEHWDQKMYFYKYREYSANLFSFLQNNPQPGDIFHATILSYPKTYQTIKNIPIPPFIYERGNTYVSVGFVDLHMLMMGIVRGDKGCVRFVGYEMSEICIARSLLIYTMMKLSMDEVSILQVWFSTGWCEKTLQDFSQAASHILENGLSDDTGVLELLRHWIKASLSLEQAKDCWSQISVSFSSTVIGNLCNRKDRVEYCRYILTGQIFGDLSTQKYGNVTKFSKSERFSGYSQPHESMFATLSFNSLKYDGELLRSFENHNRTGLHNLMDNIEKGLVTCEFLLAAVVPTNTKVIKELVSLHPYHIDWSNIPEYTPKEKFLRMAKDCSVAGTGHSAHFMNWSKYICGTFILEYGEKAIKVHQETKQVLRDEYKMLRPEFFHEDKYFVHPYNESSDILAHAKRDKYVDYFFNSSGIKVKVDEATKEPQCNFFQRTAHIFNLKFYFDMD